MKRLLLILFIVFSGCSDIVERQNLSTEEILQLKQQGWLPTILVDTIPNLSISYSIDTNTGCAYFPMISHYLKSDSGLTELKLRPEGHDLITKLIKSYSGQSLDLTHCDIYKFNTYYIVISHQTNFIYVPFKD